MTANAGRKAQPRGLKLVKGRAEGKDSGGREVKATPGFVRLPPEPPEILDGSPWAKELWEKTVPELQRLQLTKPVDAPSLAAYCLTWQRFCMAQQALNESPMGVLHSNSQGVTRNPAIAVLEAASKELRAWASEFGLTPAAESKLVTPEAGDGEHNPFA